MKRRRSDAALEPSCSVRTSARIAKRIKEFYSNAPEDMVHLALSSGLKGYESPDDTSANR
jgi:hypothetical protein